MVWMYLTVFFLNFYLVLGGTCEGETCNDVITMQLLDGLKATLKAELDVSNMNNHLSAYIKQQVQNSVEEVMKVNMKALIDKGLEEANSTIVTTIQQKLEDEMERPVFHVELKTHPYKLIESDDILKFDDVRVNRGKGYSPSTGIFTAPRSGLYQVSCVILNYRSSSYVQYQLNKNDNFYSGGFVDRSHIHGTQTLVSIVPLDKGDRVYIKHRGSATQLVHGASYSSFSGHFIQSS